MLPCNLIFEGVGKVGKTTLINALCNYLGSNVVRYKMPVPQDEQEGYRQYDLYANMLVSNRNATVIYDRGHISEMVYAPAYRQYYSDKYHEFLHDIDGDIASYSNVPSYIVYVFPRWQSVMTPGNRPTDDLIAVPRLYAEALYHTRCNVIRISTHNQYAPFWRGENELVTELLKKVL